MSGSTLGADRQLKYSSLMHNIIFSSYLIYLFSYIFYLTDIRAYAQLFNPSWNKVYFNSIQFFISHYKWHLLLLLLWQQQHGKQLAAECCIDIQAAFRCILVVCITYMSYFLILCSFLQIISTIFIGVGSWAYDDKQEYSDLDSLAFDPSVLLIIVGCLMFVITFCGCVGALRENKILLKVVSISKLICNKKCVNFEYSRLSQRYFIHCDSMKICPTWPYDVLYPLSFLEHWQQFSYWNLSLALLLFSLSTRYVMILLPSS